MDFREAGQTAPQLLSAVDVAKLTTLSRATIYRRVAEGTFPRPAKIGAHRVAWPAPVISAFVETAIAQAA